MTLKKESIIIYSLIIILIVVKNIFNINKYFITIFFWLLIASLTFLLSKNNNIRIKDKYGKAQTLLIITIFYLILYYLCGLFLGFEYSPYSRKIVDIFINIINFIFPVILQEYVRHLLVENRYSNKSSIMFHNSLVIILFILLNISFNEFIHSLSSTMQFIKYFIGTILPISCQQILLTYLSKRCGFKSILFYRLPLEFIYILFPIFPKLDWFLLSMFNIMYYFITYQIIDNEYFNFENRKRNAGKLNFLSYFTIFCFVIITINFILGNFKYQPIAIMSNSMVPEFFKGDVIIVKKIEKKEYTNLKIGDIILYKIDDSVVSHRIVAINKNGKKLYFTTKGDNNNAPDSKYVKEEQIIGLVKYSIPKIGYPTVWLSEIFNDNKPNVEMGDV